MRLNPEKQNKFSIVPIFIAIALMMSASIGTGGQTPAKTVEVLGTSIIYGDNVATARDRAILNGLASALMMVTADYLPIESLIQNFQVLNETIYGQSDRFVQGYKVLTEASFDKFYRVMVQATILVDEILSQLSTEGLILGKRAMPRLLFFIMEQNIGESPSQYWRGEDMVFSKSLVETVMAGSLREKGFLIMERSNMSDDFTYVVLNCRPDFDDKEVSDLGAGFGADVVIVGKSMADIAPNTMGEEIKSFSGTISVRAIRTDTGGVIASITQKAVAANSDDAAGSKEALSDVGILAGETLSSQILAAWQSDVPSRSIVEVIVSGTGNLPNFVKFRSVLSDMPGVNKIQIREMRPNEAIITVDFQGNAKVLAEALLLKTFETFGINISEVSSERLKIELIPG